MDFKQIQELVKLIHKTNLTEFKMEDGDFKLSIRTEKFAESKIAAAQQAQQQPQVVSMPAMTAAPMQQMPAPVAAPPVAAPAAEPAKPDAKPAPADSAEDESNYVYIKSPIVGTFYRASSPDKPPFIKVGDTVDEKSVVCIVEAMKLFNEIEAEVKGKIVKVLLEDASPVEYDQALFLVDPNG